jgi:4'-phosphopantetheinyl transferase
MTTALRSGTDDIEVVTTQLTAGTDALCVLAGLLSDAERERASRLVFDRDRRRFIVSRVRLRQLLAERLGVPPESLEFAYGAYGKPAIALGPADPDLRFNVSHCDDLAVYAFSCGLDVGVDVEAVRALPEADRIAAHFFSPRENDAYRALDPRDKPLGFFNCWTRKEAFIKALGDGLCHPLDGFDVSLAPDERAAILRVGATAGDECGWRMESFAPSPGFVAAVVTECRRSD